MPRTTSVLLLLRGPATLPGSARGGGAASHFRLRRWGGSATGGLRPLPCRNRDGLRRRVGHPILRPRCQGRPRCSRAPLPMRSGMGSKQTALPAKALLLRSRLDQASVCTDMHHNTPPCTSNRRFPHWERNVLVCCSCKLKHGTAILYSGPATVHWLCQARWCHHLL